MSNSLLKSRSFPGALRASLFALAALAVSVPSLRAQTPTPAQLEISDYLPLHTTIHTAGAKALATAVSDAIASSTNVFSGAQLASAALEPYPVTVNGKIVELARGDRDTSAGIVAAAAVNALISATDVTFDADAATLTDDVVIVNGTNATENLNTTGKTAVVKAVLAAISTKALTDSALLTADQSIGNALATDSFLEGLPDNALTTVLQGGIAGVTGVASLAPAVAPEAAEDFAQGILFTGTIPNALPDAGTYPSFAVAILKSVSANTNVDELVSFQVGLADATVNSASEVQAQAALVVTGSALFKAYPAAADVVKITQGLTGALPAVDSTEIDRVNYVAALTTAAVKDADSIASGSTFTDPFFASNFVGAVLETVHTVSTTGVLDLDAATIATGVGKILGQDSAELTHVADVYSELISGNGTSILPVSAADTYAENLIAGAIKGLPATVLTSVYPHTVPGDDGGKLVVGTAADPTTATTVTALEGIEDLFAAAIVQASGAITTRAEAVTLATRLGTLAGEISAFVKNQTVNGTLVGEDLAGTLAQYVSTAVASTPVFGAGAAATNPELLVLNAIKAHVDLNNTTAPEKADVQIAITDAGTGHFNIYGQLDTPETAVTDL